MTADRVILEGLVFTTRIGVSDEERAATQEIEVALELEVDTRPAAASDAIGDAVDYMAVAERVGAVVRSETCRLVERLGARIADELLSDRRVRAVRVEIRKRAAGLPGKEARAGVSVVRP